MLKPICWWIGENQQREFAENLQRLQQRYHVVASSRKAAVDRLLSFTERGDSWFAGWKNSRARAGEWSEKMTAPRIAEESSSPSEVGGSRGEGFSPRLIVWAQRYPLAISHELVERAGRCWPSARQLALVSSWSESEGRTGRPLVGVSRHSAVTWTNSLGLDQTGGEPTSESGRCAILVSAEADWAEALAGGLATAGWVAVWGRRLSEIYVERPNVIVIDLARQESERVRQIAEARRRFPQTPQVGLLAFPRAHEILQLRDWGLSNVLSQPVNLTEVLAVMEREAAQAGLVVQT